MEGIERNIQEQNLRRLQEANNEYDQLTFVNTVHISTIIFIALEVIQWMILTDLEFKYMLWMSNGGAIMCLIGFLLLQYCDKLRHMFPINWILALIVVEGSTFLSPINYHSKIDYIIYASIIATSIMVLLLVLGMICPIAYLPGDIFIFCITCGFFIALIVLVIIGLVATISLEYIRAMMIAIAVFMIPTVLYHSEILHGRRVNRIEKEDHLLVSLALFLDYSVITSSTYYILFIMRLNKHA